MSSEKVTDVEALIAYIGTPPGERDGDSPLTPKQQELFDRLNYADDLLRQYGEKKAIQFLVEKFGGDRYSRRSAQRDVAAAMALWSFKSPHKKDYLVRNFIDELQQAMRQALKAQKYGEYARIAGVFKDVLRDIDVPDDLTAKGTVVIMPMPDEKLLEGIKPIPDEEIAAFKRQMLRSKSGGTAFEIQDAQVVDDDDGDPE